jgi:translation initiation factor IF-2
MGHVDHGKTTLLDHIRHSNVTAKESGGITQHIGAYQVEILHEGAKRLATFIDTPGHEAFSAMRARGGEVADIAVLVVAADDGVMPQTKEAIAHIKAAEIPMIVAINKMDNPGANVDRVKKGLSEEGVLVEGYGGDVVTVPISAKTGQGVPDLLDLIILTADLTELVGDPSASPTGVVIEAEMDKFRGAVATLIIKNGTLKVGQEVTIGGAHGRIKQMIDGFGKQVREAGPGTPVEILGLSYVPAVGSEIGSAGADEVKTTEATAANLQELFDQEKKPDQINLIIKADVQGSLEAIIGSLSKLDQSITKLKVVFSGTGEISDSDVNLARATQALILAFRVKASNAVAKLAETQGIQISSYDVIYKLLDDLGEALAGIKAEERPNPVGVGDIIATFPHDLTIIFGTRVKDGAISRDQPAKVMRGDEEITKGRVKTIRHLKDEVPKAEAGKEYGILLDLSQDEYAKVAIGDRIESFPKR